MQQITYKFDVLEALKSISWSHLLGNKPMVIFTE